MKPFSFAELMTGLRALERRRNLQAAALAVGPLRIDLEHREATANGTRLDLTPIEFGLLAELLPSGSSGATRSGLLCEVWGYDFDPRASWKRRDCRTSSARCAGAAMPRAEALGRLLRRADHRAVLWTAGLLLAAIAP